MSKFLDEDGVAYMWQKIKKLVKKWYEEGMAALEEVEAAISTAINQVKSKVDVMEPKVNDHDGKLSHWNYTQDGSLLIDNGDTFIYDNRSNVASSTGMLNTSAYTGTVSNVIQAKCSNDQAAVVTIGGAMNDLGSIFEPEDSISDYYPYLRISSPNEEQGITHISARKDMSVPVWVNVYVDKDLNPIDTNAFAPFELNGTPNNPRAVMWRFIVEDGYSNQWMCYIPDWIQYNPSGYYIMGLSVAWFDEGAGQVVDDNCKKYLVKAYPDNGSIEILESFNNYNW